MSSASSKVEYSMKCSHVGLNNSLKSARTDEFGEPTTRTGPERKSDSALRSRRNSGSEATCMKLAAVGFWECSSCLS